MEQLESPALGKPKETVEHQDGKIEAERMLDSMSTEELEELARSGRHLRALPQTHSWCGLTLVQCGTLERVPTESV
jgi:hypothetical protein